MALALARNDGSGVEFVIGGGDLYAQALPFAEKLYLTLVDSDARGDVYFPEYEKEFTEVIFEEHHEYNGLTYTWMDLIQK